MSSVQSQDERGNQGVEENDVEEEAGCHVADKSVCGGASWGGGWGRGQGEQVGRGQTPGTDWEPAWGSC